MEKPPRLLRLLRQRSYGWQATVVRRRTASTTWKPEQSNVSLSSWDLASTIHISHPRASPRTTQGSNRSKASPNRVRSSPVRRYSCLQLTEPQPMVQASTADAERARAFYEDALGLALVADEPSALVFD